MPMQKTCQKCSQEFEITSEDLEFYKKISPKIWEKIYEIPTPTLCTDCRQQRRLTFRNEGRLYKRTCDKTWKNIISAISPDKDYIVYDKNYYITDSFEALDFWMDFNFSKTFFQKFDKLLHSVPLQNLSWWFFTENSEYINFAGKMKDCYMDFACWECEKVFYSAKTNVSKNTIDSSYCMNIENSYQVYNCIKSYNLKYCINTNNSRDSSFLINCENCENCFLSNNLVWKKYCILNKQYSKQEYFEKIKDLEQKYFSIWWKAFDEIKNKIFYKNLIMLNCQNSFWDNIENAKNCYSIFHFVWESQNSKYLENWWLICNDVYDWIWVWDNLTLSYELVDTWVNASKNYFLITCYTCQNTFYSINCHNSSNLFWCIWVRNKKYCIFNKQYTKQEYEKLVSKIIEKLKVDWEWWEFFPANISPFWYNETIAQEYFPFSKPEILEQNFNYSDYEASEPKVEKIIPGSKLPEDILKIPDDILNWAIKCEKSWKIFKIIKAELEFYRKHNLPIPKRHPDIRHLERIKFRNPRKLFDINCDKCNIDMKSTFSKNREEKVFCEKCYNKKIY
jgi:hypothetical protein